MLCKKEKQDDKLREQLQEMSKEKDERLQHQLQKTNRITMGATYQQLEQLLTAKETLYLEGLPACVHYAINHKGGNPKYIILLLFT